MSATLFHKITESFAGALFVGHSEGELLFLEQVALRSTTPAHLVDSMVRSLTEMMNLSGSYVAAPSHVVRFMGQIGIVTPYFEAIPLRLLTSAAREKQVQFPVPVALKITLDVLDGLCQYHTLDAALRGGVCPDHLLVGTNGDTRVGNVGVAAMSTKESPWRGNAERLAYLAPEQVMAPRSCDAKTDVYSVAVILWEMIANQPRLNGSAMQILEALRSLRMAPSVFSLGESHVSQRLFDILKRALQPEPSLRHPSVGAFARDLLEAGEEPAGAGAIATFLEHVAEQPLQALRDAVKLHASPKTLQRKAPTPGALRRTTVDNAVESPKLPEQERPAAASATLAVKDIPPDGEHTAVFKVTAELLQKARRGLTPSEPPQGLAAPGLTDPTDGGDRTVTFQVPESLLEEARRLFEGHDDPPSSSVTENPTHEAAPSKATDPSKVPDATVQLLEELRSGASEHLSSGQPSIPRQDEDETTIWRPSDGPKSHNSTPFVPAPPSLVPAPPSLVPAPPSLVPAPPSLVPAPPSLESALPPLIPAPPSLVPAPPSLAPAPPSLVLAILARFKMLARFTSRNAAYWVLGLLICAILGLLALLARRVSGH